MKTYDVNDHITYKKQRNNSQDSLDSDVVIKNKKDAS